MDIGAPFTNADVVASLRRAAGLPECYIAPEQVYDHDEPVKPPAWNVVGRAVGRPRKPRPIKSA